MSTYISAGNLLLTGDEGNLLLTGDERAEQERQRAERLAVKDRGFNHVGIDHKGTKGTKQSLRVLCVSVLPYSSVS